MTEQERIVFKCDPAFRRVLQGASQRTGVPMSEIIRRAVLAYLVSFEKRYKALSDLYEGEDL